MIKLEKETLVLCMDESNKLNVILKKHYVSEVEKNKSLEQELAESKVKLEKLSSIKPAIVSELVFELPKPKDDKVYIPPFKRNHKENANFARLDKGKSSDVDVEVSKPMSKPPPRLQEKPNFMPTCHHCGVVGHIRRVCGFRAMCGHVNKYYMR